MPVTPKQLAKVTGKLSSMHLALGPIVRLFSRNIYHDIESRFSWHEAKCISKETADKLKKKKWTENQNSYNGYTFKPRP